MRISDWSSDVCSSDLLHEQSLIRPRPFQCVLQDRRRHGANNHVKRCNRHRAAAIRAFVVEMRHAMIAAIDSNKSEEYTAELKSVARIQDYDVCFQKQKKEHETTVSTRLTSAKHT